MDILKSTYYIRSNKYLSFFGQWPYQKAIVRFRNQLVIMLIIFSIFLPQCAKMIEIRHYFHYFILSIPSQLYYTQFIAKNILSILGRKEIKKVLERIKRDFQTYKGDDLKILYDYCKKAQKFNNFYTVYMFMVVTAYSILPLSLHLLDVFVPLNDTRLEQVPRLIKYNVEALDRNVLFIILHGSLADMLAIVFVIGFDTLYLSFSYHICALFVIVSDKIRDTIKATNAQVDSGGKILDEKSQDVFYRDFVKTIAMHQYVLEFVKTVDTTFAILNIFSIGCAMVPLTITGFEVVMNKGNVGEMLRYFLYAFAEVVHLFYYNWPGQKVKDHSLLIYQACYDSEWYKKDFSLRNKRLMKLMMIRSQKPCQMTAGKIYILGLENFAAVIKLSMSYFTVLSSMT